MLRDVVQVIDGLENPRRRLAQWRADRSRRVGASLAPTSNIVELVGNCRRSAGASRRHVPEIVADRTVMIRARFEVQRRLSSPRRSSCSLMKPGAGGHGHRRRQPAALDHRHIRIVGRRLLARQSVAMALTIGTGFIVDDAIVMIENIVRNIRKAKRRQAARRRALNRIHGRIAPSVSPSLYRCS
jgi:multidrug efflux pump